MTSDYSENDDIENDDIEMKPTKSAAAKVNRAALSVVDDAQANMKRARTVGATSDESAVDVLLAERERAYDELKLKYDRLLADRRAGHDAVISSITTQQATQAEAAKQLINQYKTNFETAQSAVEAHIIEKNKSIQAQSVAAAERQRFDAERIQYTTQIKQLNNQINVATTASRDQQSAVQSLQRQVDEMQLIIEAYQLLTTTRVTVIGNASESVVRCKMVTPEPKRVVEYDLSLDNSALATATDTNNTDETENASTVAADDIGFNPIRIDLNGVSYPAHWRDPFWFTPQHTPIFLRSLLNHMYKSGEQSTTLIRKSIAPQAMSNDSSGNSRLSMAVSSAAVPCTPASNESNKPLMED